MQKILAAAGVASRRKAEEMIAAGRVTVNGEVITELGTKADAEQDAICVDGASLKRREKLVYFLLHKPKGYVTTVSDPEGRPTVMELMKNTPALRASGSRLPLSGQARVYPVGRLDYASEGLLLMTNDGELAQKLTKAGPHVPKTYLVKISGKPSEQVIEKLRAGVMIQLDDGRRVKTSPAEIRLAEDKPNPWYEVTLAEGRNRQIRRMFKAVGFDVEKIRRVQLGPLKLDLLVGQCRELTPAEIARLKAL